MTDQQQHYEAVVNVGEKKAFSDFNHGDRESLHFMDVEVWKPGNRTQSKGKKHKRPTKVKKMELLDLSDDVLGHILPFLNDTKDAVAVSLTCTRLNELCLSTKSLWTSCTVKLGREKSRFLFQREVEEEELEQAVEMMGDRTKKMDITVELIRDVEFDLMSLGMLKEASKLWDLDTLHVHAIRPVCQELVCRGNKSIVDGPLALLLNSCLTSASWPTGNSGLETLSLSSINWANWTRKTFLNMNHEALGKSVKILSLDAFFSSYQCRPNQLCVQFSINQHYNLSYPGSCDVGKKIGTHYGHLHKLEINSIYLTDSLLEGLSQSGNASLQNLTIVVDYFHCAIRAWHSLFKSLPSLKVSIEAKDDFIHDNIESAIPCCVPVVSFKVYCFHESRDACLDYEWQVVLFNVISLYSKTLQSVAIQSSSRALPHSALLRMVTRCSQLRMLCLDYRWAAVRANAILKMASFRRSWLRLGVLDKRIAFPRDWTSRKDNKAKLCAQVSEKLGYVWKLEHQLTNIFADREIFRRIIQRWGE